MRELKPDVLLTPKVVWLIRIGSETQDFCCPILTRVISHHSSKWGMYKGQSFEDLCGLPLKGKRHPLSWKWTSRGSKPQSFELTPLLLRLGLERRMELVSKHSWLCHVLSFNGGQESTDRLPLWEALVCLEGSFPFELLWGFHMSERTDQNSKRGPRQDFQNCTQMFLFWRIGNTHLSWIAIATGDRQNNALQEAIPWGLITIWGSGAGGWRVWANMCRDWESHRHGTWSSCSNGNHQSLGRAPLGLSPEVRMWKWERQGARRKAWAENAAFLAQSPLAQTNPPDPDQWNTTIDMFAALYHLQNIFPNLSSELLILPFPFSQWITRAQRQS